MKEGHVNDLAPESLLNNCLIVTGTHDACFRPEGRVENSYRTSP
jgi:hypothetical protein